MFWAGENSGPGQGEILNWDAENMKKRLNRGRLPCAGRESSIKRSHQAEGPRLKQLKEVLTKSFSFDDMREKVTDLAQSGVAKSKQLAEIAKLKTSNMGEEDTIKKAYLELGRLYYAERGAAPEGAYAAACGRISQAKAAIETNNARIAELKAQGCVEEEAESVTTEPVVEDVPPEEPAPEQEVPETPAEEAAAPEEAPAAPEEPKQDV